MDDVRPSISSSSQGHDDDGSLLARVARLESIIANAGLDEIPTSQPPAIQPDSPADEAELAIDELLQQNDVTHYDQFDHSIVSSKKRKINTAEGGSNGGHDRRRQPARSVLDLEAMLPPRSRCDHLVHIYFTRVEWIHHVVHRPSFYEWYGRHWTGELDRTSVDLHTLGLLFAMLALALHFDDRLLVSDSNSERRYYDASCRALNLGDYLSRHSIPTIQTLIMQGLWLNDMGYSETHHANLGLAIKIANLMGLSRLDARLFPGRRPALNMSSHSFVEAEMKRRIYWSLVCQDAYTASSCHFTYSIQNSQIKVDVFGNASDEELADVDSRSDRSARGALIESLRARRTGDLATTSAYHIAKIPFAQTAKKFVDLYNADDLSYDSILSLDAETRRCFEGLPAFLKYRSRDAAHNTREVQWQQLFLSITLHNRLMRLHRPFLTRGYTDPVYRFSVDTTVSSAKSLLGLIGEGQKLNFPGLRWWVVLVHIFTAGVALAIDLHYHVSRRGRFPSDDSQRLTSEGETWVQRAIAFLSEPREFSDAANRAVDILKTLYDQVQSRSAITTPQQSGPEETLSTNPDWNRLFEQALGTSEPFYSTDQAILETMNTFALGFTDQNWPTN